MLVTVLYVWCFQSWFVLLLRERVSILCGGCPTFRRMRYHRAFPKRYNEPVTHTRSFNVSHRHSMFRTYPKMDNTCSTNQPTHPPTNHHCRSIKPRTYSQRPNTHALPDERNRYTTQKRHKAAHGSHQPRTPISHHAITSSPTHKLPSKFPIAQTSTAAYLPSHTHIIYHLDETHTRPSKQFPPSPCGSPRNPVPAATLLLLPWSSSPRSRVAIRIPGVLSFPVHLIEWREVGRGWLFY